MPRRSSMLPSELRTHVWTQREPLKAFHRFQDSRVTFREPLTFDLAVETVRLFRELHNRPGHLLTDQIRWAHHRLAHRLRHQVQCITHRSTLRLYKRNPKHPKHPMHRLGRRRQSTLREIHLGHRQRQSTRYTKCRVFRGTGTTQTSQHRVDLWIYRGPVPKSLPGTHGTQLRGAPTPHRHQSRGFSRSLRHRAI